MKTKNLNELKEDLGADGIEVTDLTGRVVDMAGKTSGREAAVLQEAASIQRQKQTQVNQRMQALLSGKTPPPNEFVAYMLTEVKNTQAEFTALQASIREVENQLQAMKSRAIALQGETDRYFRDIHQWDRPLGASQPKEN